MARPEPPTTLHHAEAEVSSAVYAATRVIEDLEHTGRILGNGHHIRQKIAAFAVEILRERWQDPTSKSDTSSTSL